MTRSLAEQVAMMTQEERDKALEGVDMESLRYDWNFWGRPEQRPPKDKSWKIFAIVAGRGFGKTRAGAEWVQEMAMKHPGCRIALVGRTAGDVRNVIVEGESGIIGAHADPEHVPTYSPATRRLKWPNGSMAETFSSEEPAQLRGPQFHFAWADETAAWRHIADDSGLNSWDNLKFATRLPQFGQPQIMVTTTPKRTKFMFDLIKDEADTEMRNNPAKRVIITRGSTMENAGYLDAGYLEDIVAKYKGTRLEQQELMGLMLDALEGALWNEAEIEEHRVGTVGKPPKPRQLPLRVIAVDPSVSERPGDECGIIVAEATRQRRISDRHCYIVEDASLQASPADWAIRVAELFDKYRCPVIVEVNQGGALVKNSIHAINPKIPVLEVRATQGKALRAEPVTLKYQQGKVHHVGSFAELEGQMQTWVPGEGKSPDRLDALVYAVLALIVTPPKQFGSGPMRARSFAGRQLPGAKRPR